MTAAALSLFPAPPRNKPLALAGFRYGDLIEVADPKQPGLWRKGRVIAVLPKSHLLTLRVERPDAIVDVNPLYHPSLIRHRAGEQEQ